MLKHGQGAGDGIVHVLVYSSNHRDQWEPVCGNQFDDVDARKFSLEVFVLFFQDHHRGNLMILKIPLKGPAAVPSVKNSEINRFSLLL